LAIDQGRSDDRRHRPPGHGRGAFGVLMPKPTATGRPRRRAPAPPPGRPRRRRLPSPRSPRDRDIVDEARGARTRTSGAYRRWSAWPGGSARQADPSSASTRGIGLLRRTVDDDQAVDPASAARSAKPRSRSSPSDCSSPSGRSASRSSPCGSRGPCRARLLQGHAALSERRRPLDGRALGHRIGEGKAELDDVGAGGRQALEDTPARSAGRVAGHHIGDEGRPALAPSARRNGVDAGFTVLVKACIPRVSSATVKMSLSPRPDRIHHDDPVLADFAGESLDAWPAHGRFPAPG
jgi:hypothetical protein